MKKSHDNRISILDIYRSPMMSAEQTRLVVLVAHWTEIAAHDLEVGVLPDIVLGHFEHAEMEVGDRTEGPARDEDDGLFGGISQHFADPVRGKGVVGRVGELVGLACGEVCVHGGRDKLQY